MVPEGKVREKDLYKSYITWSVTRGYRVPRGGIGITTLVFLESQTQGPMSSGPWRDVGKRRRTLGRGRWGNSGVGDRKPFFGGYMGGFQFHLT